MSDFAERYGPWAVVAGGSEGVGSSVARLLGQRGINVVLVSRRKALLEEVATTVSSETRSVELDLSTPDAARALAEATADLDVGLFIYNAGADPHHSKFLDQPIETWQSLVMRNCNCVLSTTHHFGGLMAKRGSGGIALVTSGAAWAGGAYLAAYSASKAFNLMLAESLWAELKAQSVDVLAMVLGMTDTPAFRKILNGREVEGIADPDDVARDLLDHLGDGPTFPPDPSPFGPVPRRDAVELMSQGGASLLEG